MLKKRLTTALLLLPLPVAAVWFGEPWFTILVAIIGMMAAFEFYRLGTATKVSPVTYLGLFLTLLLIISRNPDLLSRLEASIDPTLLAALLLTSAMVLSLAWVLLRPEKGGALTSWAWTMAGILYVGWLLGHLVALRGVTDGRNWVFFALLATFASDAAAFFSGRAVGRHRLAPRISPNKTWEGAAAGIVGALVLSLLFASPSVFGLSNPLHIQALSYPQALLIGALVSIFGQFGDLVESLLKRNAGVKDSGNLFPGHGGVLDRLDSVVFAGIVVYYYVVWATQ